MSGRQRPATGADQRAGAEDQRDRRDGGDHKTHGDDQDFHPAGHARILDYRRVLLTGFRNCSIASIGTRNAGRKVFQSSIGDEERIFDPDADVLVLLHRRRAPSR